MLETTFTYERTSSLLRLYGLPDNSLGHEEGTIGIVSRWSLSLVGATQLEGKIEHLQSLLSVLFPYARHIVSGIYKEFGSDSGAVIIRPYQGNHIVTLRSSREGVEPLNLTLDDAELADLVRCADDLVNDPRVRTTWKLPTDKPLPRSKISGNLPLFKRIQNPIFGTTLFLTIFLSFLYLPPPSEDNQIELTSTTLAGS